MALAQSGAAAAADAAAAAAHVRMQRPLLPVISLCHATRGRVEDAVSF